MTDKDITSHLKRVTVGDVLMISKLTTKELDARSFAVELLAHKLTKTDIATPEIEQLSDDELLAVFLRWFSNTTNLQEKIESCQSLDQLIETLKEYAQEQHQRQAALATSALAQIQPLTSPLLDAANLFGSVSLLEQIRKTTVFGLDHMEGLRNSIQAISAFNVPFESPAIASSLKAIEAAQIDAFQLRSVQSRIADLVPMQSPLFDIGTKSALSMLSETINQLGAFHTTLGITDSLASAQALINSESPVIRAITEATQSTIFAQGSLARIPDISSIGIMMNEGSALRAYGDIIGQLTHSYADYVGEFVKSSVVFDIPRPQIIGIAGLEYFSSSDVAEIISVQPIEDEFTERKRAKRRELYEENENPVRSLLSERENGFVKMLDGASQALESDNPDRLRHFSISMRELFTHILHILSPDQDVRTWDSSNELYHDGKPTRRARLLYICRHVNQPPLESFFKKDIEATLELINFFQSGTHGVEISFSLDQALALRLKMEGAIRFMLEVSKLGEQE